MKYHKHLVQSVSQALEAIFFEDRHADKCIEFYFKRNRKWGSRDRRFFAETVYDCVRWWRLYWHLASKEECPEHTLSILGPSLWFRGLSLPSEGEYPWEKADVYKKRYEMVRSSAIRESFPDWLYEKIIQAHPQAGAELTHALNKPNRVVLRMNSLKGSRSSLMKNLRDDGLSVKELPGTFDGVYLQKRSSVFGLPSFKKGLFEVQDGSSQQVAQFLDPQGGERVIDACAGAGGKTLHISSLMENKGRVIALDIHQWKLDQLKLRARRNTASNVEMRLIEGSKTIKRLKGSADRLLLDVPCTGLGVLRRNPDTKWKLSPARIDELLNLQAQILKDYSVMLKPDGFLVYSTCSLLPEENENQVEKFLSENSDFKKIKQRWIWPFLDGYDGFYMALLQKTKSN